MKLCLPGAFSTSVAFFSISIWMALALGSRALTASSLLLRRNRSNLVIAGRAHPNLQIQSLSSMVGATRRRSPRLAALEASSSLPNNEDPISKPAKKSIKGRSTKAPVDKELPTTTSPKTKNSKKKVSSLTSGIQFGDGVEKTADTNWPTLDIKLFYPT